MLEPCHSRVATQISQHPVYTVPAARDGSVDALSRQQQRSPGPCRQASIEERFTQLKETLTEQFGEAEELSALIQKSLEEVGSHG